MELFRRIFGEKDSRRRVGLFVDGPNVLRSEFDVDLDEVRDIAVEYGPLALTRLYVDQNASPGLIQAAEARGFEVVTTSGDVDVRMAVDATDAVVSGQVDVLVVASRDTDFKPALEVAAREGVKTVAIAPGEYGRSDALRNAAEDAVTL
ncbi:NYN domain-containing protein [Haloarcula sp. CBA1130]|uniref:NYN domain-containing protein n=1 Tax=unclassified Haloarcula TaxID=2624677 RepID=UPI001244C06B|nr:MULTISPECIES: NYN domain-containing protein [unclassified Haloarcula]KAA9398209.1 NYN domain-containing protein [Haloarcula sp. CBA1129]KAA9402104.1 NYN domain-containing protein [Haloarcula sp. CBA1130]